MKRVITYLIMVIITVFFTFLLLLAPIITYLFPSQGEQVHGLFKYLCHQYPYRSFCFVPRYPFVIDCIKQNETGLAIEENKTYLLMYDKSRVGLDRPSIVVVNDEKRYVFPVCSRDVGFYIGSIIGLMLFIKSKWKMKLYQYILLIVPFAFDGLIQLITPYESVNLIRFITGSIAGVATAYYFLEIITKET